MTEPSQYFKGRTVQEQMNEVIGYVDARAEEVAAAKADDVLVPAEQAKTDAIAAKEAAEDARDTTLAALPTIQQDITDLKAEDVALDGRLDTVELKVQTAEGNIVTIQGQIVALQTADGQNVKLTGTHAIGNYAMLLTDNQTVNGVKFFTSTMIGMASLGTTGNSDSITVGNYKSLFRIDRTKLSTFRGVASIISWERSSGINPEFIQIGFHGNTAVAISRYSLGTPKCDYFVSADDDYVYIGIKSRITNIIDNAKQLIVQSVIGFNNMVAFEHYNGSIAATPDGTLIAETS